MTAETLLSDGIVSLRLMRDQAADFAALSGWLSDPRVLEFYEGRDSPLSIEEATREFSPSTMAAEANTPCFIEFEEVPIGYLQFYPAVEYGDRVWGLDQFIGVPELWGRGLGTRAVNLIKNYLFLEQHAAKCILDPQATNHRAIRCYEKAGFQKVRLLERHELHEGEYRDCWLMEALPLTPDDA